jgi:hypothetical protein
MNFSLRRLPASGESGAAHKALCGKEAQGGDLIFGSFYQEKE